MKKLKKPYLMVGGTLLPAFAGVCAYVAIKKQAKTDVTAIILFAALAVVGGYITAKMLKEE